MKIKLRNMLALTALLSLIIVISAKASGQRDLARVRAATGQFQRVEAAQAAGYQLLPGVDFCFDNPGVGGMGYHYINPALIDLHLDPLQPEALVYAPGPNGQLQLVAVEYVVPAEPWDAENEQLPVVLGQELHSDLIDAFGIYALHAWVWKNNPAGMHEHWNPTVSCD